MTTKINTFNKNFATIDSRVLKLNGEKQDGIKEAITYISDEIVKLKKEYNLNNRKSLRVIAERVLGETKDIKVDKSTKRAYNIALIIRKKNVKVHTEILTVSQVENLVRYGESAKINKLHLSEETYLDDVSDYLKELKTRIIEVKTFEKIPKKTA